MSGFFLFLDFTFWWAKPPWALPRNYFLMCEFSKNLLQVHIMSSCWSHSMSGMGSSETLAFSVLACPSSAVGCPVSAVHKLVPVLQKAAWLIVTCGSFIFCLLPTVPVACFQRKSGSCNYTTNPESRNLILLAYFSQESKCQKLRYTLFPQMFWK